MLQPGRKRPVLSRCAAATLDRAGFLTYRGGAVRQAQTGCRPGFFRAALTDGSYSAILFKEHVMGSEVLLKDAPKVGAAEVAARTVPSHAASPVATMIDNSARMMQMKALGAQINNSPRMLAQREKIASFGAADPAQPNHTGLPDQLKGGVESLSGMSMDHVKVHYNSAQPAQLGAHAYAQGSAIHVAPGQEQHLPHEAWHVVQQAQGRVRPTMQMAGGVALNDDNALETEADLMGEKALQRMPMHIAPATSSPVVQNQSAQTAQLAEDGLVEQVGQVLQIAADYARPFVQYLLQNYPKTFITGVLLVGGLIYLAYSRFSSKDPTPVEAGDDQDEAAQAGSESESESESESDSGGGSGPQSDDESVGDDVDFKDDGVGLGLADPDSTDDFAWKKGKAWRDKRIAMTPARSAAWLEFCQNKPKKKGGKSKKKKNAGREIFESRQKAQAAAAAKVPKAAPFNPLRAVALPDGSTFYVNTIKPAVSTKSSSLSSAAATKPLAVVYGQYAAAGAAAAPVVAEVHVHFNDTNPINSHTGAHVKIGAAYRYDWPAGNATAQASLLQILDLGFGGDRWNRPAIYLG
jgi:hypothetical protein